MLIAIQIVVSIAIITLVLLQERSSGIGGIFGGGGGDGGAYQARRGMQKVMHYSTILLTIVFAGLALLSLLL